VCLFISEGAHLVNQCRRLLWQFLVPVQGRSPRTAGRAESALLIDPRSGRAVKAGRRPPGGAALRARSVALHIMEDRVERRAHSEPLQGVEGRSLPSREQAPVLPEAQPLGLRQWTCRCLAIQRSASRWAEASPLPVLFPQALQKRVRCATLAIQVSPTRAGSGIAIDPTRLWGLYQLFGRSLKASSASS
jgi:hypothetical protein